MGKLPDHGLEHFLPHQALFLIQYFRSKLFTKWTCKNNLKKQPRTAKI